jgi:hypothetical protein
MVKLPESAKRYFWDVKFDEIDPSKNARYVIERLLEYGDFPELRWLLQSFSRQKIANVLKNSRSLSLRSANYWSQILKVPKRDILCLSKRFQTTQNQIWKR